MGKRRKTKDIPYFKSWAYKQELALRSGERLPREIVSESVLKEGVEGLDTEQGVILPIIDEII